MTTVVFTDNLRRHINCPELVVSGATVAEVLASAFKNNEVLKGYILDEQGRLRKHMLIAVDGKTITDRIYLSDPVQENSEVFVLQALSGG